MGQHCPGHATCRARRDHLGSIPPLQAATPPCHPPTHLLSLQENYKDLANSDNKEHETRFQTTQARLAPFKDKASRAARRGTVPAGLGWLAARGNRAWPRRLQGAMGRPNHVCCKAAHPGCHPLPPRTPTRCCLPCSLLRLCTSACTPPRQPSRSLTTRSTLFTSTPGRWRLRCPSAALPGVSQPAATELGLAHQRLPACFWGLAAGPPPPTPSQLCQPALASRRLGHRRPLSAATLLAPPPCRHDYCGVAEDLEAYWPKLRSGGIFAGHDYIDAHAQALKDTNQDWSGEGGRCAAPAVLRPGDPALHAHPARCAHPRARPPPPPPQCAATAPSTLAR
jgi:hypothetical protein